MSPALPLWASPPHLVDVPVGAGPDPLEQLVVVLRVPAGDVGAEGGGGGGGRRGRGAVAVVAVPVVGAAPARRAGRHGGESGGLAARGLHRLQPPGHGPDYPDLGPRHGHTDDTGTRAEDDTMRRALVDTGTRDQGEKRHSLSGLAVLCFFFPSLLSFVG